MKLNSEICYTIEVEIRVVPNYYHTIKVDVVADSIIDAFAIAKETINYIYQYSDDCIVRENLIEQKPIYRIK